MSYLPAQNFILRGCHDACADSTTADQWIKILQTQAPDLSYRGFTHVWLPKVNTETKPAFLELTKNLRKAGIQAIMDLSINNGDAVFQLTPLSVQLNNDFQIKNFRIVSKEAPKPVVVANFLNEYYKENANPGLVFTDIITQDPNYLAQWVNDVLQNLPPESRQTILPRVYDYPLREALRRACSEADYDVRDIYTNSLRDSTALIGYNIITGVNNEHFINKNNKTGDADDMIQNPLLAYAYLLTNNQIGLPEIFDIDYYGSKIENKYYTDQLALKAEIDQLIKAHREYIYNATEIEYLNRIDTDKESVYLSAKDGADASRALIFQLDGTNTPAGKVNKKPRDVIIAINFADVPLKVIHQVNMSNVREGDIFTDVLGRSAESSTHVQMHGDIAIANAVYLELPARSYSIWVQGEAAPLGSGLIQLTAQTFEDFVELTWEAPAEADIKQYEVEKSINGSPFRRIFSLAPLGEAGANYLHTDEARLPEDEVAYRIKAIFKNGTVQYSSVQELKPLVNGISFELLEYTKPGIKTLKIRSNQQTEGKITVFNAGGKQVLHFTQAIKKGVSLAQIDISTLPKGIYFVNIYTKNKEWSKKVINK